MTTARSISVTQLKEALSKGPAGTKLGGELVIDWTIIGRILRDKGLTLEKADELSRQLAKESGEALRAHGAGALEPAVLIGHGRIICGFFPPREINIGLQ